MTIESGIVISCVLCVHLSLPKTLAGLCKRDYEDPTRKDSIVKPKGGRNSMLKCHDKAVT